MSVTTTTVPQPIATNQTATFPIATRQSLNLSTGDTPCSGSFTSYAVKSNSIVGLSNITLVDNIASFDVIGALGYFIKQMYCNGILVAEAVITITGTANTTLPCGCNPCNNQDATPIWQFFKQVGSNYIYKDINSCSPTYGSEQSMGNCNSSIPLNNCGCRC